MKKLIDKLFHNPFFVYVFVWIISLGMYFLHWSDTYPELSFNLVLFILITVLIATLVGYKLSPPKLQFELNENNLLKLVLILLTISTLCFTLTFLIKGVPLYNIMFSQKTFDYAEYKGIQYLTISGIAINAVALSLILTIYHNVREKKYIFLMLISILPLILLFNRLFAFVTFLPFFFTWGILSKEKLLKFTFRAAVLVVVVSLMFGIVGNYREEAKKRQQNVTFYNDYLGEKYPTFFKKEFFWVYFYMTSPIGKLQYVIEDDEYKSMNNDFGGLFLFEILPNALGVRLNSIAKCEERKSNYGYPRYFAGSAYSYVYLYGKWLGLGIYVLYFFSFIFLMYRYANRSNSLVKPVLIGTICTFATLSIFTNTIMLTVLYLILGVGFVLSFILNRLPK
ncbi:hypothetical protein ACE01N_04985 [Saccharicrinis sp. FJH2]|uniref:hypothetical protein n=1 Tax=Saccharicrinis sp. FJH65 TaxID=3344659 RepID=UPI0035F2AC13